MGDLRRKSQKAHPHTVQTIDKMRQAVELRKAGASYADIGATLKCTKKYAYELVVNALEDLAKATQDDTAQLRKLELERLDSMLMDLWTQKKNPRVADTILRIADRRAKLLGLDSPLNINAKISKEVDGLELIEKIVRGSRPQPSK